MFERPNTSIVASWRLSFAAKSHEVAFRVLRRFAVRKPLDVGPEARVSVVVVTNRPVQLNHILASYDRQDYPRKQLVIVTNGGDIDKDELDRLAQRPDISWAQTLPEVTLGEALNLAVSAASGSVVAKFDDDDWYAPSYLTQAVEALAATRSGVVGRKTYYVYLEEVDRTVLVYPGNENRRVGRVAGGSIVANRKVFESVQFPPLNLGEDVTFVRAVERAGYGVYSVPAPGFLQWRGSAGHTWQIDDREFLDNSDDVGPGHDVALWAPETP